MSDKKLETLEGEILQGKSYDYSKLESLWKKTLTAGNKKDKLFKIIAAVDNGEQWAIYKKKIRKSQSLPVSNLLSSIRDNRQGAMSITGFVGEFTSSSEQMDSLTPALTDALIYSWKKNDWDVATESALENMLTFGTGITMVTSVAETPLNLIEHKSTLDDIHLVNIDPTQIYVDPGAKSDDTANFYFIKDTATLEYIKTIPLFRDSLIRNEAKIAGNIATSNSGNQLLNSDFIEKTPNETEIDYITYIGKTLLSDGTTRWDMVWLFGGVLLHKIEGIRPNRCPLVFGREKIDKRSFWGQSSFKQNLALQLSINEIDSAVITHAKSQQDPPVLINGRSGMNAVDFAKNRDKPGSTFIVPNGNPADAIHYASKGDLPRDITMVSGMMMDRIKDIQGASDISRGSGSGSLQTAGGISQVLQRSTLKDIKVVKQYQTYLKNLYRLVIEHIKLKRGLIRYSTKDHMEQEMQYKTIDLSMIDWENVTITVDIFNHTGAAKESNTQIISELFQQSIQYSSAQPITEPAIMTADEFLEGVKEPNVHKLIAQIQLRRQKEREINLTEIVTHIISLYLQLVSEGTTPQEALMLVSQEYSTDPGILKGFKVAELAQQQQMQQEQAVAGQPGVQGSNQHTNTQ